MTATLESSRGEPAAGELTPLDEHNRALLENARPPQWRNPRPVGRYNLVVLGGGTAGLVAAAGAAALGAKVALVERRLLGGDCLNFGCVPSKALLRCARAWADVRDAGDYGVRVPPGAAVDFGAVMARMRALRAGLSPHDSAARFGELGVDVFLGAGRFSGPETIVAGGQRLRFARACIATGARPAAPPVEGLEQAGYLTNETVFSLTSLPRRLVVLGGGPIGCELAQAFARFGAQVTLLELAPRVLAREDPDAAGRVARALRRDGVEVCCSCRLLGVRRQGALKLLNAEQDGQRRELRADQVLVGVGRLPNVADLGLEAAGVAYDGRAGVRVNDRLRTSNRNVYAAGDVCFPYRFTHVADALARIVVQNALFLGRRKASALTIPWCIYTDPELAHVGLRRRAAEQRGIAVRTFTVRLEDVDRAVLDGQTDGLLKIHVRQGSDQILGATLVARHAGEMISEITAAMAAGAGLGTLAKTIHCYPTQAQVFGRAADAYQRTRLTPGLRKLLARWLAWRR